MPSWAYFFKYFLIDAICLPLRDYAAHHRGAPQKRHNEKVFEKIRQDGYSKVHVNGQILNLSDEMEPLDRQKWHNIEIMVDSTDMRY